MRPLTEVSRNSRQPLVHLAISLHQQGMDWTTIADDLHVNRHSLRYWVKRYIPQEVSPGDLVKLILQENPGLQLLTDDEFRRKYRARCNKRSCQARRTIKGVYDTNDRVACHNPGCTGSMRLDVTRERLGTGDSGAYGLCRCDGLAMSMNNAPHRKGSRGCEHREDVRIEQSLKGTVTGDNPGDQGIPF